MTDSHRGASRRGWLLRALQATIVATFGALLYPVLRFLRPREAVVTGSDEVVAPLRVHQLAADAEGKWPAPFNFNGKPCLLIRTPDGEVRAFNAVCTHTDCTVQYKPGEGVISCACHNGKFDLAGNQISGPPPRPLDRYEVNLRGKPGEEEILVSRKS